MDRSTLMDWGINYTEAMDRFGNDETLYLRLAMKFLNDPHFTELTKALDANDTEVARREAHSLKGVAGTLSFHALYEAACKMNDALNAGDMDRAWEILPDAQIAYDRVCDALRELSN